MTAEITIGSPSASPEQIAETNVKKPEPLSCLDAFGIAYRIVKADERNENKPASCGLGPHAECRCDFN